MADRLESDAGDTPEAVAEVESERGVLRVFVVCPNFGDRFDCSPIAAIRLASMLMAAAANALEADPGKTKN